MTEGNIDFPVILNVLGDLYLSPPDRAALDRWRRALEGAGQAAVSPLKRLIDEAVRLDDAGLTELQTEFARLFVGPATLPCPPWESVYTSPDRLMMQDAFDALRDLYADAGLAVQERSVLPDHIGAELHFLAILLERVACGGDDERERAAVLADRLLDDHLNRWIGPFTRDLEQSALLPLYKEAARAAKAAVSLIQD